MSQARQRERNERERPRRERVSCFAAAKDAARVAIDPETPRYNLDRLFWRNIAARLLRKAFAARAREQAQEHTPWKTP